MPLLYRTNLKFHKKGSWDLFRIARYNIIENMSK